MEQNNPTRANVVTAKIAFGASLHFDRVVIVPQMAKRQKVVAFYGECTSSIVSVVLHDSRSLSTPE
jgi:hypothetical protein